MIPERKVSQRASSDHSIGGSVDHPGGTSAGSQLPHGDQAAAEPESSRSVTHTGYSSRAAVDLMPLERVDRRRAAESRKTGGEFQPSTAVPLSLWMYMQVHGRPNFGSTRLLWWP